MISNQSLTCPKGTSLTFEIDMDTGSDLTGATAQWALAESWFDQAKVYITKTGVGDGLFIGQDAGVWKITVNLAPTDTLDVPSGLLYHDCKVLLQSGDVEDVANGPFSLDPSVNILDTNAPITRNLHALQALGRPSQVVALTVGQLARNLLATQSLFGLGQSVAGTVTGGSSLVFSADFTSISSMPAEISFSRATGGTYVNSSGFLQTAAIDGPRFDHDPATLAGKGLLIEEQRTNFTLQSEDSSSLNGGIISGVTFTANTTVAPDGNTTADTIALAAESYFYRRIDSMPGGTYTLSVFLKASSNTSLVMRANEDSAVQTSINVTTAFQRFNLNLTLSGSGSGLIYFGLETRSALGADGNAHTVMGWGWQIETGSFPTSYIPSTTAAVTRSADIAQLTGSALTAAELSAASVVAEIGDAPAGRTNGLVGFGDQVLSLNSGNAVQYNGINNLTGAGGYDQGPGIVSRAGFAWDSGNRSVVANGGTVSTQAVAPFASAFTQVFLGRWGSNDSYWLNGHFRSFAIYSSRLSDADLQTKSVVGAPF